MKITKEKFEEIRKKIIEEDNIALENFLKLKKEVFSVNNFLDEDGYPTSDALSLIETWHHSDPKGLFNFIEKVWHLKYFGWHLVVGGEDEWTKMKIPENKIRYYLSTAGWSGNEQIIHSLESNVEMWDLIWLQSRRGGHYIFELEVD